MKSKPAKYGMKLWALADAHTRYCWNIQPYTGKIEGKAEANQGRRVVMDLVEGLPTGLGVVTDNFFTSISLAEMLKKKNMTLLGTLRKNRVEVPKEVLPNKHRKIHSSMFLQADDVTLVSYVPKKKKAVVLLSTEHHDKTCAGKKDDYKPQMILDYNKTKGGVDSVDQMVAHFSSKRSTRRWPVAYFMTLLDIGGLNAYVVYSESQKAKPKRSDFLESLCLELVKEYAQNCRPETLHANNATMNNLVVGATNLEKVVRKEETTRGKCVGCDTFTRSICHRCSKRVCIEHGKKVSMCSACLDKK